MVTNEQAQALADRWIAAWNAHDLAAILALYCDDFTMRSPYIADVVGDASGQLCGKDAVGAYWRRALQKYPELKFELLHVLTGVDSVALVYRSLGGRLANEVFVLAPDGRIAAASALYAPVSV